MPRIPTIASLKKIAGKRVIVRLDLNVPLKNGKVTDPFRIKRSIKTINYLKANNARVVIVGHIGKDGTLSLKPVARCFNRYTKIGFIPKLFGSQVEDAIAGMKDGTAIMLENLRSDAGEQKNTALFGKKIAGLGDIYVNEAFSVSHRSHASIVGIPKYIPAYAGFLFQEEYKVLRMALKPKHPFLLVLGGAKFSTKIPLLKKYVSSADYIFIGGALANNFLKESGHSVGASLVEPVDFSLRNFALKHQNILFPSDGIVTGRDGARVTDFTDVHIAEKIVDVGPRSVDLLKKIIMKSKFIVFNGPLGLYEEGFDKGTVETLRAIAKSPAESLIGGGDTGALITKLTLENKFSFISTAGGAMLVFLSTGTLPGIEALEK